nr:MAG TPA: hypothetical protein [Caudoviricetes sp.]
MVFRSVFFVLRVSFLRFAWQATTAPKPLPNFFQNRRSSCEKSHRKQRNWSLTAIPKAIPHKERLATLHAICLQISLQSLFRIFPHASVAQSLCGIAL